MNYAFSEMNKKVLITLAAIIIIVISAMFISSSPTGNFIRETNVQSEVADNIETAPTEIESICTFTEEEYTEMEPYIEEQCISVPKTETNCATTQLKYSLDRSCYWSNNLTTLNSVCTIKNLDSETGMFTVNVGVVTSSGNVGENKNIELNPLSSGEVIYTYNTDIGNCFCTEVTIPTKETCYDKIVNEQQCFDVTKYRPRIQTREIKNCD
ncbi:MAG: hypothetical protein KJ697_00890 [Nanoarchaeota archaeon]|nr:hypothetical protein [Nanoarchaeota archaeon]